METLEKPKAQVFLAGDSGPVLTPLTVEAVAALIHDTKEAGAEEGWVRLPMTDGRSDALLRPSRISAIVPAVDEDDA